ncbi:MAG: PAS domain-containing protein, partial [Aureliella sp.]
MKRKSVRADKDAHLRATIEESEASTEELRASNQELQAMNEELRSATEELETSREELQSINEELRNVNDELKSSVDQLANSNNDLQNLMAVTDIATVFLDQQLRIQRFTPSAMTLFSFISTDLGRPLSDLSRQLDYPEIVADAERSLAHLQTVQREVSAGERWYIARTLPYRNADDHIAGVVLTFTDITTIRKGEAAAARLVAIVQSSSDAIIGKDLLGIRFDGVTLDVSEQKMAEQEVVRLAADSERQRRVYETVLTNTPDFVYVFSLDHRVLYANESLIKMWGRGREGAIGKTFLEIGYEPWHAEMHDREIDQVRATRQSVRGEVPFNGSSGRRQYDYIFVPVIGADGEVEAVAGTTRDVTERYEAERAIRAGEERLRTALTAAHMVAWEWTPADGKLRVSENAREVFGLPVGRELTSINEGLALLHPDDLAAYQDTFQKAIDEQASYLTQYRLIRSDDARTIWIEERGHAVFDQPGGGGRLFGVAADVTDRVQAEVQKEKLLLQVEGERGRLAEVFRQAPAFMCVLQGPSHVFELANDRYFTLVGQRDLIGKTVRDAFSEVAEQGFIEFLDGVYQSGEPFIGTGVRVQFAQTGEQYVDFVYQALRDLEGHITGIVVVGVEVTARYKAEEALRVSEERSAFVRRSSGVGLWYCDLPLDVLQW